MTREFKCDSCGKTTTDLKRDGWVYGVAFLHVFYYCSMACQQKHWDKNGELKEG